MVCRLLCETWHVLGDEFKRVELGWLCMHGFVLIMHGGERERERDRQTEREEERVRER